jgi:hypothetical protein
MNYLKLTLMALVIGVSAQAQTEAEIAAKPVVKTEAVKERATFEARATKQATRISNIVGLDDGQFQNIKRIYLESYPQIKEARKAAGNNKAKAEEESKKIMKERRKSVEAQLNNIQTIKFKDYLASNKDIDADEEVEESAK